MVRHGGLRHAMRALAAALFLSAVLSVPGAVPAWAQDGMMFGDAAADGLEEQVRALRPGQFLWYDDGATAVPAAMEAQGAVSVLVSLPEQRAYVFRGTTLIGVASISTGRRGRETPIGEFEILQKRRFHRSNLYSNAPMPFMQRLTWDGIALHAGHNPGYPASHGCIRLPDDFARRLFTLTDLGGTVEVTAQRVSVELDGWAPLLRVEMAGLGGEAFNFVTLGGQAPPRPEPPIVAPNTGNPLPAG